jgi:hypothetical protein
MDVDLLNYSLFNTASCGCRPRREHTDSYLPEDAIYVDGDPREGSAAAEVQGPA